MVSKTAGPGFYEFLIEAELQQYYSAFKNELKVQNVAQLKYVSEDDMAQIGMSRPEMRRLTKFFHRHYPQTYLAKMKKKLLHRRDDSANPVSLTSSSGNVTGRNLRNVAPGRHIIQADAIVSHKTLGSGEFGTVQQGVWTSDDGERIQVAIKCLSQERMENNPVEFLKEAAIMHTVDHEHIVRLYGVVLDTSSLVLVTELAPLRSLLECLKEPSMRPNLTVQTLFDFSIQICDGMQYLESKRLIHRDLAARNILVFSRSKVKISDFGLSRALGVGKDYYQTNFNVNLKLPIAWCAPECINFLRFTSASDVWAFGVTLWEMFSYGFQPWAALTGHQILEAIDEPNYQRLERPECCPVEIYYQIMLKCWQHLPVDRPTFAQVLNLLPECKPEQVQTIRDSESRTKRDVLSFEAGDLITVIDKKPFQGNCGSGNSGDEFPAQWKGVLKCGKAGFFNPAHTITYLGPSLPCVKESHGPFNRDDSRSSSMRKGRLSADMISSPQGDLKHTGHVGPDGQFFGDISFMNTKCWVPRQVVPPYKPETLLSGDTLNSRFQFSCGKGDGSEILSHDTAPLLSQSEKSSDSSLQKNRKKLVLPITNGNGLAPVSNDLAGDHEYHEISDEENEIMTTSKGKRNDAVGLSNPALSSKSHSPLDSPRFEKAFDIGPSLMDEVFGALESENHHPDEANVKNELREMCRHKKKFATVKPISSKDRKTLDHAIAIAELASRSMLELDRHDKSGRNSNSFDDISSPRTPNSPTHRRKFFHLGSSKNSERERRNYSQEAASIPDIQSTLTEEAKDAYNSLIEKPSSIGSLGFLTPSFENKSSSFHFPEKCGSKKSAFFDNEPLSPPPPTSALFQSEPLGGASSSTNGNTRSPAFLPNHMKSHSCTGVELSLPDTPLNLEEEEVDSNPLRLLRKNKVPNVLPLPPRDRRKFMSSKSFDGTSHTVTTSNAPLKANQNAFNPVASRHQRKHPLLIPGKVTVPLQQPEEIIENAAAPPPPPPKPLRQHLSTPPKQVAQPEIPTSSMAEGLLSSAEPEMNETMCSNNIKETPPISTRVTEKDGVLSGTNLNSLSFCEPQLLHPEPLNESYEDELADDTDSLKSTANEPPSSETSKNEEDSIQLEHEIFDFEDRRRCFEGKEIKPKTKCRFEHNRIPSTNETQLQTSHKPSEPCTYESGEPESTVMLPGTQSAIETNEKTRSFRTSEDQVNSNIQERIESEFTTTPNEKHGEFRCSPTKEAIQHTNPAKIRTVQRIMGSSATEKECVWALDICRDDCAHSVKLLRLKSLLPESLLHRDIERVVSVLEMSHWDVVRASDFLLSTANQNTKNRTSLRKFPLTKSEEANSNFPSNITCGEIRNSRSSTSSSVSNSNSSISLDITNSSMRSSSANGLNESPRSGTNLRPTRV